ncbi:MAG: glycosyltransferase [Endomicrobia bacterium]|nr:glycosyltransferase [Endomicrobiia bacterium]
MKDKVELKEKQVPLVSLIIPCGYISIVSSSSFIKEHIKFLISDNKYEIIIVDNSNFTPNMRRLFSELEKLGCKIIPYPFKFSYPLIYNYAANFAKGEYFAFLDTFSFFKKIHLEKLLSIFRNNKNIGAVLCKCENLTIGKKFETKFFSLINFIYYFVKPFKFFYYFVKKRTDEKSGIIFKFLVIIYYLVSRILRTIFTTFKFFVSKSFNFFEGLNIGLILIKRDLFKEYGGFDKDYINYCYQNDLLMKVKERGYEVFIDNSVKMKYFDSLNLGHFKYNKFPVTYDKKLFFNKWISKEKDKSNEILVIKLMTMGDAIMCTPVIKALKEKYSQYRIVVVSLKPWSEIFEKLYFVDKLISLDISKSVNLPNYKIYDLVGKWFVENYKWYKIFQLNCLDHYPEYRRTGLHLSDFYASMANVYPLRDKSYIVVVEDKHKEKIKTYLDSLNIKSKNFITIHTNGGWFLKNWDDKKWVELSNLIYKEYGFYTILVGGKDEGKDIFSKYIFNVAGKFSIKETAALISESVLFVGLDSGPMHLASAMNVPVVALFGNTHPKVGEPRADNYICIHSKAACEIPCGLKFCEKNILCTSQIGVDSVFKAIKKLLSEKNVKEIWIEDKPAKVFFKDWEWHIVES